MCSQAVLEYVQSILQIVQSWPLCRVEEWEVWEFILPIAYHYFFYLPLLLLLTITSFTYHFSILPIPSVGREGKVNLTHYYFYLHYFFCKLCKAVQSGIVAREGKSILPITPRWHYTRKLFSPSPVRKSINIDSHAQGNSYFLMSFCKGDTFSGVYG